jgi:hypothetical protein
VPIRRLAAFFAIALLAGVAASCGGGGTPVRITRPAVSHSSPGGAVMGFFTDYASNNKDACTYVVDSQALQCLLALNNATATVTNLGIGETTERGDEALVSVTGKFCVTLSKTTTCRSNSNPKVGQPNGGSQQAFDALYKPAQHGRAINNSAIPCQQTGGKWYISLLG